MTRLQISLLLCAGLSIYWWGWRLVLALLAAGLVTVSSLMIAFQEKMLYIPIVMGYKTVLDNPAGYRSPGEHGFAHEDFYVDTIDGEKIHGWHIRAPESPVRGIILFCHENAGNIGLRVTNLVMMSQKLNCDVVAFDYRGYGHSTGRPTEPGLIVDTETVFNAYLKSKIGNLPVFVYGRSLGGAVAIQWAATTGQQINGLMVENTFTSIADMVGSIFPLLNFSIIKKHLLRLKWDSASWIRSVRVPLILIGGEKDEIVPFSHMKKLDAICTHEKISHAFVTFPNGTHNDTWVVGGRRYWLELLHFISNPNGSIYDIF